MIASASYSPSRVPEEPGNPNHPLLKWGRENGYESITALADLLGVSRPRLSQIVTRRHRPAADLVMKIVRATGLEFEGILELTPAEIRAGVSAGWAKKPKPRRKPRK